MAAITPPNLTPAPTPAPQRNDQVTFSNRVDAFVTWLITAVTEFGAVASNVYANATDAYTSAGTATTKAALTASDAVQTASDRVAAATSATMAVNAAASISSQVSVPIHAAASKTTPVDADELGLVDSAASNVLKKLTWENLKATLAAWINGGTLEGSFTNIIASGAIRTLSGGKTGRIIGSAGVVYVGSIDAPIAIQANNINAINIDNAGAVTVPAGSLLVTTPALLGYGTGAGGTVTQATSKATSVTLNKPTGQIIMNSSALASNTSTSFVCNNTAVGVACVIVVTIGGGVTNVNNYQFTTYTTAGSFQVSVRNTSAGSLSESIIINFAILGVSTA